MSPRACILHTSSSAPPRGFSLPTKFIFDQLPGIVITYCCFGCTRSVDSPGHCFARPPSLRQAVKRVEDGIGGNGLAWMQVGCRWVDSPSEGVLWTDFASLVDQRQAVRRVADGIGGNGLAWMQVGCRWVDSPSEGVLWTDFASLVDQRQAVKRVEDGVGGNGLAWMQVGCRWVDSPSEGVLWTDFASLGDQRQAVIGWPMALAVMDWRGCRLDAGGLTHPPKEFFEPTSLHWSTNGKP
jgi:hypothetical protein